jgi:hypothetical protein
VEWDSLPLFKESEVIVDHQIKRKNERLTFEAPVIYTAPNYKKSRKAKLKNYSSEGMHIEDSICLKPDTHIFCRILKQLPHSCAVTDPLVIHAKIKWCNCIDHANQKLYSMGLQHVSKLSIENAPVYHCALCGEEIPDDQLLFVDDFLCLGSSCFDMFTDLDDGVIKEGIENYMNGNVI